MVVSFLFIQLCLPLASLFVISYYIMQLFNLQSNFVRFCRRLFVSRVSNIQVCPIYGRNVLAFQGLDNIVLYESKNEDKSCDFEKLKAIKSSKLANFACFESGHIEYLAIGGKELRLFHFLENDFQDAEMYLHFDGKTIISSTNIKTSENEQFILQRQLKFCG